MQKDYDSKQKKMTAPNCKNRKMIKKIKKINSVDYKYDIFLG